MTNLACTVPRKPALSAVPIIITDGDIDIEIKNNFENSKFSVDVTQKEMLNIHPKIIQHYTLCIDDKQNENISFFSNQAFSLLCIDDTEQERINHKVYLDSSHYSQRPQKDLFTKQDKKLSEFQKIIKSHLENSENYYSIDKESAYEEINRIYNFLEPLKFDYIELEITPNGSAIFDLKLNSEILLIINKPIDKLNDDNVILTVIQDDIHLFTNLKSIKEVTDGAKQLLP